jgi:hypothetical protein
VLFDSSDSPTGNQENKKASYRVSSEGAPPAGVFGVFSGAAKKRYPMTTIAPAIPKSHHPFSPNPLGMLYVVLQIIARNKKAARWRLL